jgi:hypothetical protein
MISQMQQLLIAVFLGVGLAMSSVAVAQTETMSGDQEGGTRATSGDDFDGLSLYYRWPAQWLQAQLQQHAVNEAWQARWDVSIANWDGPTDDIAFVAAGPVVEWQQPQAPWRLSLGVQPTLISNYDDAGKDLGGAFQFTSHISVAWAPSGAWVIGLRAQHTSNASIYEENPGVDLFGIEVGIPF